MTRVGLVFLLLAIATGVMLLSAVFTVIARRVALRIGFVDRPGGHKSHTRPTPYAGGCAILLSAWVAIGLALVLAHALPVEPLARLAAPFLSAPDGPDAPRANDAEAAAADIVDAYLGGIRARSPTMLVVLAGGLVLHLLGLRDDKRPLAPWLKLGFIVAVALLVAYGGGVRIAEFAGDLSPILPILLTAVWFIVIVNAMNFLDNMDGLSAGIAGICLVFFGVCGVMAGQVLVPALACVFVGSIAGFLVFNFPPAKIFMGDAGSLVIGYMLAVISSMTTYYFDYGDVGWGVAPFALGMPPVILAVPLYDFTSVVVIRLLEGRNPMKGDQRHFSHRLVDRGLSRRDAVLTIYLATAATGLAATLLPGADLRRTLTIGVMVLMVLAIIAILEMPLRKKA